MKLPKSLATVSLGEAIRSNSRRNPHAVALLAPQCGPLSYGKLSDQVDYVGHALRALGIERSDRVAVVLPNGPDMAAAFLGIAAYATCAPLNPSYRDEEFEFYLTDLGAKAIVVPADTDLPARDVATRLGLTVMDLEPSTTQLAEASRCEELRLRLRRQPIGERTRMSRWCCIPQERHRAPSRCRFHIGIFVRQHATSPRSFGLSPDDRCLNVMPLFHIHGLVGVLLSSMFAGGSVVCSTGYEASSFGGLDARLRTDLVFGSADDPSVGSGAGKGESGGAARWTLRLIRSSSSSLPPTVMAELEETFRVPVIESYGMTEAAHQMASNPLPPAERKPGSVGLPAGPEMAVMDDDGKSVARGRNR